jgi:hypothetical protein
VTQFACDPATGELLRENGSFVRIGGTAEILQHVTVRFRLFRGECFLDVLKGMRFRGLILEKGTPPSRVEGEFTDTALGTPGVVGVSRCDVEVDRSTRHGSVAIDMLGSIDDARQRIPIHDVIVVPLE